MTDQLKLCTLDQKASIWEFPKIRGTLFGVLIIRIEVLIIRILQLRVLD